MIVKGRMQGNHNENGTHPWSMHAPKRNEKAKQNYQVTYDTLSNQNVVVGALDNISVCFTIECLLCFLSFTQCDESICKIDLLSKGSHTILLKRGMILCHPIAFNFVNPLPDRIAGIIRKSKDETHRSQ